MLDNYLNNAYGTDKRFSQIAQSGRKDMLNAININVQSSKDMVNNYYQNLRFTADQRAQQFKENFDLDNEQQRRKEWETSNSRLEEAQEITNAGRQLSNLQAQKKLDNYDEDRVIDNRLKVLDVYEQTDRINNNRTKQDFENSLFDSPLGMPDNSGITGDLLPSLQSGELSETYSDGRKKEYDYTNQKSVDYYTMVVDRQIEEASKELANTKDSNDPNTVVARQNLQATVNEMMADRDNAIRDRERYVESQSQGNADNATFNISDIKSVKKSIADKEYQISSLEGRIEMLKKSKNPSAIQEVGNVRNQIAMLERGIANTKIERESWESENTAKAEQQKAEQDATAKKKDLTNKEMEKMSEENFTAKNRLNDFVLVDNPEALFAGMDVKQIKAYVSKMALDPDKAKETESAISDYVNTYKRLQKKGFFKSADNKIDAFNALGGATDLGSLPTYGN